MNIGDDTASSAATLPQVSLPSTDSHAQTLVVGEIFKLQPHRTMHLQGFDDYGASAALWGASDNSFTVSGVFRDLADFAVFVLFQKDDPFGHPLFSYLPDGDLTGITIACNTTGRAGASATYTLSFCRHQPLSSLPHQMDGVILDGGPSFKNTNLDGNWISSR